MGTFRYPLTLLPVGRGKEHRVEALVDTGATYTWIPRTILESLGYKPRFKQPLRLADGRIIRRSGTEAVVEIDGVRRTTIVIHGDAGSEALLGAFTLEAFSLAAAPLARRLVPTVALLMSGIGRRKPRRPR